MVTIYHSPMLLLQVQGWFEEQQVLLLVSIGIATATCSSHLNKNHY